MINYIKLGRKNILLLLAGYLFSLQAHALNLIEVVHHVLDTHPVVMANEKSVDAFQYRYYQTFGSFLPEISTTRIEDREKINNERSNISRRYLNTRIQDFSFKQNLFAGFKDFSANRAAMWRYNSTKENVFFNINSQVLDSIIAYITVLQQQKLLAVADENQKFFRKALNNLEKLFESGATDKADYLLVKNNLENARSTMLQARKDYDSALAKFKNSINLEPSNLTPIKSVSKYILSDPETIIETALENSPAIKETRAKLKTLEYEFREQVATLFPTIDFNISKNMQTNTTGLKGKTASTKVGVTANFNLFRGGKDYLEAQAKAAERASLDHQIEATTRNIKEQVTETWLTIKNTLEKKVFIEQQILSADQSLNSYLILFDYNQSYLLSVLNAKKVLFASQTENVLNNSNKIIQEHRLLLLNNTLIPTLEEVYSFNNS